MPRLSIWRRRRRGKFERLKFLTYVPHWHKKVPTLLPPFFKLCLQPTTAAFISFQTPNPSTEA
jgi:hypothetical protein